MEEVQDIKDIKPNTETGHISGPSHAEGGVPVIVEPSGQKIEVEGEEYLLCAHAWKSLQANTTSLTFTNKTNKEILDEIFQMYSCEFTPGKAQDGDFVICRKAVLDETRRDRSGTPAEILTQMQTEHGCNAAPTPTNEVMAQGGPVESKLKKIFKKYIPFIYMYETLRNLKSTEAPAPTPQPAPQAAPQAPTV